VPSAVAAGLAAALLLHYAVPTSEENPAGSPASSSALQLRAEPNGANVRLDWDRTSPLLAGHDATLTVADGNTSNTYRLTPVDFRNGYLDWPAHSRNLTFRLEIERPGQWPLVESLDVANPAYPINSSSDTPGSKPSPAPVASAPSGETPPDAIPPVVGASGGISGASGAMAGKSQTPGRMKRFFSGITSKAAHLWPFHSAKPEQQTP
jgi:hypothetical protein